MSTGITFTFEGATYAVALSARTTKEDLQRACASRLGLSPAAWRDVVAFTSGQVLYPPSYVVHFAPSGAFTNKVLQLVLRGRAASEAAPKSQAAGMKFDIGGKSEVVVEMKDKDLKAFALVKERSRLGALDLQKLYSCFRRFAGGAERLTKVGFDGCIRELVPGQLLSRGEKQFLSFGLSKIFHAFDRDGDDTVDFKEFIAGFSILALGGEREKLEFAFALFDRDGDGFIDRQELTSYLRAFLTAVLALNSDIVRLNADYVNDLIERTARRMCAKAFETADTNHDDRLSYEEMYAWYRNGGDILMPWLSLVASPAVIPPAVTEEDALGAEEAVELANGRRLDMHGGREEEEELEEEEALMLFPLIGEAQLEIEAEDVGTLNAVIEATRLNQVDAQQIIRAFVQMSVNHCLTQSLFQSCVRELIPGTDLAPSQKRYLSHVFSGIYEAYDHFKRGQVPVDEIASGFVLFSRGSKSLKLSLSFNLFDSDGDGAINLHALTRFIRSFLTILIALKVHKPKGIDSTIDQTAKSIATDLLQSVGRENITFEEFGIWYNEGGDRRMPWVELYDLSKWPDELVEEVASEDETYLSEVITDEGDTLEIRGEDMIYFSKLLELSQMYQLQADVIQSTLFEHTTNDLMITRDAFDECLKELIDMDSLSPEESAFLRNAFGNIFYAYDRTRSHVVSAAELASGLSLLAAGTKSVKLSLAFDLFDQNEAGEITGFQAVRFLRSFLTAIFAINTAIKESREDVWDLLDRACTQAVESMVDDDSALLSFVDFADWYEQGGFHKIPWLELLDIRKWPFGRAANPAHGTHARRPNGHPAGDAQDPAEAEQEEEMIQFVLDDADNVLEIRQSDADALARLVSATTFGNYSVKGLRDTVERSLKGHSAEADGAVTLAGLMGVVQQFAADEVDDFLREFFQRFYRLHDAQDTGKVSAQAIINGLSVLANGSKADKLLMAFESFGTSISRAKAYLFIYELLLTLFTLAEQSKHIPAHQLCELVHDTAVDVTGKIFSQASRREKDALNFAEFAEWYTQGGFEVVPWLELLDLTKWPSPVGSLTTTDEELDEEEEDEDEDYEDEADDLDEKDTVIFKFKLPGGVLQIKASDAACLEEMLELTELAAWQYAHLHQVLKEESSKGTLTSAQLNAAMRKVVKQELSLEQWTFLSSTLVRIFTAFKICHGTITADLAEVSSGMSLFTKGNKSDKLELSFGLFGDRLDFDQLKRYIRSFLTVLLALVDSAAGTGGVEDVATLADVNAASLAKEVLHDLKLDLAEDRISFEQFAHWYTEKGYTVMPWLELLSLRKWPRFD